MKPNDEKQLSTKQKSFSLSMRTRKAFAAIFLAGGLLGGQAAQASVPAEPATIPNRVAAVRDAPGV